MMPPNSLLNREMNGGCSPIIPLYRENPPISPIPPICTRVLFFFTLWPITHTGVRYFHFPTCRHQSVKRFVIQWLLFNIFHKILWHHLKKNKYLKKTFYGTIVIVSTSLPSSSIIIYRSSNDNSSSIYVTLNCKDG